MPRFRTRISSESSASPVEFDLCTRCASDEAIVRTIVNEKLRIPVEPDGPLADRVPHRSYDFQARPTPCISCARILTSDDD
jgi:hypothetical protein